ncbi:MAG: T9SS type A sorting domain-containing protein [Bacteroidales bacterium]|nr:T9SS type A sorting domain-containing protein [Bacteroidales bacterium]
MKKTLLTIIAALLLGGVVNAQDWGETDSHAKSSNTPIVASVTLDGNAVTPTADYRLGAFVNDSLRGIAAPHTDNYFWIQVFYNQGTTETISFKLYDGNNEYTTCSVTPTTQEEGWGTPSNPVVLDFATTQTQSTTLAAGWTWWSTPIEMEGNTGLEQLQNSISQYGTKIMSQSGTRMKRPNGSWMGGFTSLENEQCYKINVSETSTVTMTGVWADPNDHEITLAGDGQWNWIGYPVTISQQAGSALANLTPETGDAIMGPNGTGFYRNGRWIPNITLTPGSGYLYKSNASTTKTFVYAVNRSSIPYETQEQPFWIANTHRYENCMAIVAVVYIGEEEQRDETMELGAFVNGECTGSAKLFYVEEDDRYFTVLTVGANDGDRISFGLVNNSKGVVYNESSDHLAFSKNAIVGYFDQPYEIHFSSLGIEESTQRVAMYPNPVDRGQAFKLNIPQEEEVLDVTIVNALGAVVRHDTGALKSTITGLPVAGVYTIKVYCRSGNTYYGRLIVK